MMNAESKTGIRRPCFFHSALIILQSAFLPYRRRDIRPRAPRPSTASDPGSGTVTRPGSFQSVATTRLSHVVDPVPPDARRTAELQLVAVYARVASGVPWLPAVGSTHRLSWWVS